MATFAALPTTDIVTSGTAYCSPTDDLVITSAPSDNKPVTAVLSKADAGSLDLLATQRKSTRPLPPVSVFKSKLQPISDLHLRGLLMKSSPGFPESQSDNLGVSSDQISSVLPSSMSELSGSFPDGHLSDEQTLDLTMGSNRTSSQSHEVSAVPHDLQTGSNEDTSIALIQPLLTLAPATLANFYSSEPVMTTSSQPVTFSPNFSQARFTNSYTFNEPSPSMQVDSVDGTRDAMVDGGNCNSHVQYRNNSDIESVPPDAVYKQHHSNKSNDASEIVTVHKRAEKTKKRAGGMQQVACFKCQICPFLCMDKNGMSRHIDEEHEEDLTESEPESEDDSSVGEKLPKLQCPGCSNVFFNQEPLKVHLVKYHNMKQGHVQMFLNKLMSSALAELDKENESKKKKKTPPQLQTYVDNRDAIKVLSLEKEKSSNEYESHEHSAVMKHNGSSNTYALAQRCESEGGPSSMDSCEDQSSDLDANEYENSKGQVQPGGSKGMGVKEWRYKCNKKGCAVRMKSHDNIEYHQRCHHSARWYECPECTEVFAIWKSVRLHLWKAHLIDMELYSCDICNYKTISYSNLMNNHQQIHGSERSFLCKTCGKMFKTRKQLLNHKVIHENKRPHRLISSGECDICQRRFSDKRMVRTHKDTVHNKLRPNLCSYCGYAASNRAAQNLHIRQHTHEKPFMCDMCDYRTSDHNSLRRHKMRHSGEKAYKCPFCTYACIQANTYKVHLKNNHPGQSEGLMFSCGLCTFWTINRAKWVAHAARHKLEAAIPVAKTSKNKLHTGATKCISKPASEPVVPQGPVNLASATPISAAATSAPQTISTLLQNAVPLIIDTDQAILPSGIGPFLFTCNSAVDNMIPSFANSRDQPYPILSSQLQLSSIPSQMLVDNYTSSDVDSEHMQITPDLPDELPSDVQATENCLRNGPVAPNVRARTMENVAILQMEMTVPTTEVEEFTGDIAGSAIH